MSIKRGDLVLLNGRVAAVVGVEGEPGVPEGHVALWFGDHDAEAKPAVDRSIPHCEAWTVPVEYRVAVEATLRH